MATWRFGDLLNASFTNETQTGYQELTPDAGNPFKRLSFTDTQDLVSGSIILEQDDYIDFMGWYRRDLRQGTLEFDFYDCRVGETRTARLVGKPSYARLSNKWTVGVVLSLEPVQITQEYRLVDTDGNPIVDTDGNYIIGIDKVTV